MSHETIYDFIHVHSKGSVKKELVAYFRCKKPRRSPAPRARGKFSGQLPGAINIEERPGRVSRHVMIVPLGASKDAENKAEWRLNNRSRIVLHGQSSVEVFQQATHNNRALEN